MLAVALLLAAVEPYSHAEADAAAAALAATYTAARGDEVDAAAEAEEAEDATDAKDAEDAEDDGTGGDDDDDDDAGAASDEPACKNGDTPGPIEEMALGVASQSVVMHDGWAALTIEQKLLNVPRGPGARTLTIALPEGAAVVVGAAMGEDEAKPHAIGIEDAVVAATLFEEYKEALERGVPPEEVKEGAHGAAVLVSNAESGTSGVVVDVAAPCSVRIVTVRLEVRLATLPQNGAWSFQVPRIGGTFVIDAPFPIRARLAGDALHTNSVASLTEAEDEPFVDVVVQPLAGARLRTRGYARWVAPTPAPPPPPAPDDDAQVEKASVAPPPLRDPVIVARAELDLPNPLAEAPAGLRMVFVVDASVSVGAAALAKEWQMLDAILDQAPPDAKYAVVAAARRAKAVVAPWRDRTDRARPVVELQNGSDIIGALKKARGIAADAGEVDGRPAVPRIYLLSDMQLKLADDDNTLAGSFAGGPLTHVLVTAEGADPEDVTQWTRSFGTDDPRALGPESTGGIWVETGAGVEDETTLYPHLIKPTRVDLPTVTLAGQPLLADDAIAKIERRSPVDAESTEAQGENGLPMFLIQGSGLRVEAALPQTTPEGTKRAARDLRIGGFLWATPLDERVAKDDSLAAFAAVDEVGAALDDDLVRTIATRAHAVSRVTSFVEVPVWRPLAPDLFGMSGCGCGCGCSCCGCRGFGCRGIGCGVGVAVDLRERETLAELLAKDARACLVPRAAASIEFGDEEILDVKVTEGGACVAERFWSHRLDTLEGKVPGAFHAHKTLEVAAAAAVAPDVASE